MTSFDVHYNSMKRIKADTPQQAMDVMYREFGILAFEITNIIPTSDEEEQK